MNYTIIIHPGLGELCAIVADDNNPDCVAFLTEQGESEEALTKLMASIQRTVIRQQFRTIPATPV